MQDVVVSVAAGRSQLPLLHAAAALGLGVVAVDRDPRAPGLARAALGVVASTHDAEEACAAVEAALRGAPRLRPVAVATKSSGPPVATAAALARHLGLPGLAPGRARTLVTKPGQLKAAALAGVRVPRHCAPPSLDELSNTGLGPPLVLKPAATRVGKQGITLVRAAEALPAAFDAARAASADGRCEIEAWLPGEDLVVCGLFRDSRMVSALTLDEDTRFDAAGAPRGLGLALPSRHAGTGRVEAVVEAAARFVRALELGTGLGLWTFRVDPASDAEPALLELHLDLAGDLVTDLLLPRALDTDLLQLVLRHLRGEEVRLPAPARAIAVRFLFESDRARASALGPSAWRALGAEAPTLVATPDPGGRIGHVVLTASDAGALADASADLDAALGRDALL